MYEIRIKQLRSFEWCYDDSKRVVKDEPEESSLIVARRRDQVLINNVGQYWASEGEE